MTVDADPLQARGADVAMLSNALRRGGSALESVPEQIKQILRADEWRHFTTRLGKEVHHERFADFVTTAPLSGLGASVDLVRRIVANDPKALDLLDRALQNPTGVNVINARRPQGTAKDQALRKLRKDAPELHAEVLAGNLTAHAAMVQAGYRPHTFTVRPDPSSAARALRKHMSPDQLAELARLLTEET